jgi:transposase-like protein
MKEEVQMDEAEWTRHLAEQARSGVSVSEYCRQHGISDHGFRWRLKKQAQPRGFVQVTGSEPIEIELPGGIIVRIPERANPQTVKTLIEALHAGRR